MIEPSKNRTPQLRPRHGLTVVAVGVIAAVVAYLALGWLVGLVAFLIKTIVVIAVIGGAIYLVVRFAGKGRR